MAEHLNSAPEAPERLVVVGAGGFVGSSIVEAAMAHDIEVLPLRRSDVDLLADGSGASLRPILRPGDAVAFVSALAPCKDYLMFEQNIRMVKNAIDGFLEQPPDYILNISSDAVYSDSMEPLTEKSPKAPENLHGQMHVARETMLTASLAQTPLGSLRPTLIYGADDPHNGYGPNRFRRQAQAGEDIPLFGNGEERRDHVSVLDVAELAIRMIRHRTTGALNATTGRLATFHELAEMAIRFAGTGSKIQTLPRTGRMPHNGYRAFVPAEVHRLFPDFAFRELEHGFALTFTKAARE